MRKTLLFSTFFVLCTFLSSFAQRSWDFTSWSQATLDNLAADATNWDPASETRFANLVDFAAETAISANGVEIEELKGLTFGELKAGKFRIDYGLATPPDRIILNGGSLSINVPDCVTGDVIRLTAISANSSTERGFTATNATRTGGAEISVDVNENVFTVDADGTVILTTTGGMQVRSLTINIEGSSVNSLNNENLKLVRSEFYTINGQAAGSDFNTLPNGMYIKKDIYENGSFITNKIMKLQ